MATRVSLEPMPDGRIAVLKTVLDGDKADRQAEAAWLAKARHRGVVRLLGITVNPVVIRTLHAGGTTMRTENPAPEVACHLLTDAAVTLADLHDRGLVHGQITLDHLVVSEHHITLCSPSGTGSDKAEDLAALGRCVTTLLERWANTKTSVPHPQDWERLAQHLTEPREGYSARRAARELARLSGHIEGTRLSGDRAASNLSRDDGGLKHPNGLLIGSMVAFVAMSGLWFFRPEPTPSGLDGPQIQLGTDLYRIEGEPSDQASALGASCADPADEVPGQAAVFLDTSSGTVWHFASPTSPAEPLAVVPGATDLQPSGCESILIEGPAGQVEIDLPASATN